MSTSLRLSDSSLAPPTSRFQSEGVRQPEISSSDMSVLPRYTDADASPSPTFMHFSLRSCRMRSTSVACSSVFICMVNFSLPFAPHDSLRRVFSCSSDWMARWKILCFAFMANTKECSSRYFSVMDSVPSRLLENRPCFFHLHGNSWRNMVSAARWNDLSICTRCCSCCSSALFCFCCCPPPSDVVVRMSFVADSIFLRDDASRAACLSASFLKKRDASLGSASSTDMTDV
mmetsp:Transcript_34909/g.87855  ORF Transcript_34909/g.87855 Transcript_34909/m.87855 type:complete len:231 (+) Transcript_34909:593-1285(+)